MLKVGCRELIKAVGAGSFVLGNNLKEMSAHQKRLRCAKLYLALASFGRLEALLIHVKCDFNKVSRLWLMRLKFVCLLIDGSLHGIR